VELVQIFVYLRGTKRRPLRRSEHPRPLSISGCQYGTSKFSFWLLDSGGGSYILGTFMEASCPIFRLTQVFLLDRIS
jgi:hypothetical protein